MRNTDTRVVLKITLPVTIITLAVTKDQPQQGQQYSIRQCDLSTGAQSSVETMHMEE
jgi:hypothetical protein